MIPRTKLILRPYTCQTEKNRRHSILLDGNINNDHSWEDAPLGCPKTGTNYSSKII